MKIDTKLLWKSIFGVAVGVVLGAVFGYINNSFASGFSFGSLIALTVILVVVFPAKKKLKYIYSGLYVAIVIVILAFYFSGYESVVYFPGQEKREIPSQIIENFKVWSFQASLLRLLHIILGLVATVCSILVAMDLKKVDPDKKKWLAFTAAVSFSVLSAFDLGDKANRVRTAWRHMNTAIIRYQEGVDTSKAELINAYEEAEKIIGDVKPSPKEVPGK